MRTLGNPGLTFDATSPLGRPAVDPRSHPAATQVNQLSTVTTTTSRIIGMLRETIARTPTTTTTVTNAMIHTADTIQRTP